MAALSFAGGEAVVVVVGAGSETLVVGAVSKAVEVVLSDVLEAEGVFTVD